MQSMFWLFAIVAIHACESHTVYVQIFEGRKFRRFRGYLAIREFFILENLQCLGLAQWLITGS